MGGRPKRASATKAASENKRLALAARGPVEAMDLLTQEDVVEREKPAPHKRSSEQPETPPKKTPDRSSVTNGDRERSATGTPPQGSSQFQVVIQQPPSAKRQNSGGRASKSQSVPPVPISQQSPPRTSTNQQNTGAERPQAQILPPAGNFERPVLHQSRSTGPSPTSHTQSSNASRNVPQQTPALGNGRQADAPQPSPQAPAQLQQYTSPSTAPAQAPQPSLVQQIVNLNRGRMQTLQQVVNGNSNTNNHSLVHPQPINAIAAGFDSAGPAHRAVTKSAEAEMTSQAPESDAVVAARNLGRIMTKEEFVKMNLAHLAPVQCPQQSFAVQRSGTPQIPSGQQLQQGYQFQSMGTPQPTPGQQSTSNPSYQPRISSFPPGHPAGFTNSSLPKPNPQNETTCGQAIRGVISARARSEVPVGSMLPPVLPRTTSANYVAMTPRPGQQSVTVNGNTRMSAPQPRASSEVPAGPMAPPARRRSNSANDAVPNSGNSLNSGPRLANQSDDGPPTGIKIHLNDLRPSEQQVASSNPVRMRIILNYNPDATPRDQGPEDSDATVSPSTLKVAPPQTGQNVPAAVLFDGHLAPNSGRNQGQARIGGQVGLFSGSGYASDPYVMSDLEPLSQQRNLDFNYQPGPLPGPPPPMLDQQHVNMIDNSDDLERFLYGRDDDDALLEFLNTPFMVQGAEFTHFPPPVPHQGGEFNGLPMQNQNGPPQRQPDPPFLDGITRQIQLRGDTLDKKQNRTHEEEEHLRLSNAAAKMLMNLKVGRTQDQNKAQESPEDRPSRVVPACLAVTQLPAAIEVPIRSRPQKFEEVMEEDDSDACVFCKYEYSFGIAADSFWLPEEASQGYCNECHEETQDVFRMWEDPYKLPCGLSPEIKVKYKALLESSSTTPLKELGDALDYKAQHKVEMSKPARQNAISNASKPCVKDGKKDRRGERKEYNLATSVRNLPRGGKLPKRRAFSLQQTGRDTVAAEIQRAVSESLRGNSPQNCPVRNASRKPSPLGDCGTIPHALNLNLANHTSWTNGVPSALPIMNGAYPAVHLAMRTNDAQARVITPNSAVFMGLLDIEAPPRPTIANNTPSPGHGTPNSGSAAISPTPSDSSTPSYPIFPTRPPSSSAQPTGPSGIPRYFTSSPPDSFLHPPPFNTGPVFCRGCPWRQIDFTKAKICTGCRDTKFLICTHTKHEKLKLLSQLSGVLNGEHEALGLGRTLSDGRFLVDGRYANCMVCTGMATYGCPGCPLRVCDECEVRLDRMCKGKLNGLLDFYNKNREHIRNDAFLLRSDNKGF